MDYPHWTIWFNDQNIGGMVTPVNFNEMMDKISIDISPLQNTIDGLQQEMTPYRKYIMHTIPMFENIVGYYRKADGVTKNKILCCIID